MTIRCDKCGAVLTPEEPLDPEVITVRIRGCIEPVYTYENEIGAVVEVIDNGPIWWRRIVDGEFIDSILKKDTEPIPDYDKTTHRLRRKHGKDEELVGWDDLVWNEHIKEWRQSSLCEGHKQLSRIYITPLKPATPDPSADCLPGYEAVEVMISHGKYLFISGGGVALSDIAEDIRFSGRYGYKQNNGTIWWVESPRVFRERDGHELSAHAVLQFIVPVIPSFVESAKQPEPTGGE